MATYGGTRDDLVLKYQGLARALARRFSHRGEPLDDLEQVAMLALVKAARRHDPERHDTFAGYATASILGELKRHFRDKTWMMRVPRSVQERYLALKTANDELSQRLGASPTVTQLAAYLQISEEDVLGAQEAAQDYFPLSLDAPRPEEGGGPMEVGTEDERIELNVSLREMRECISVLDDSEKLLLKRIYFDNWSQRQVASGIGVSQMQVSRMMSRTLGKLRTAMVAAD